MAEAIVREEPTTLQTELAQLNRDPYFRQANKNQAAYVEVFVDNFLGLFQGLACRRRQVRQTLFFFLNKVL